jgi:glycosyltransferase involved in cell wall biosynthesis
VPNEATRPEGRELAPTAARRLRILVVNLGRRGGVTEYGWLMTRALTRHADVAAIHSEFAENREKYASLDCPRLELRTFSSQIGVVLSFFAVSRFVRIWRFARQFRPDVIYYPGGHAWKPLLDVLLPRSATTVYTVHDANPHPGEDALVIRLLSWANRRRADGYVLLSEAQRAEFMARYGLRSSNVVMIPHGVFDDYEVAAGSARDLNDRTGIRVSDPRPCVLFVGRLRGYKGIDTLLEAYSMLSSEEAGPLVIAGSGDLTHREEERLQALKGRPVSFVNRWLSDADMAALVSSARFVVLPYRSATQSGVIPLASAFGIPAIASATGGLVEQVVDGETGWLFPPGDATALHALLERAYAIDEADYRRMSVNCREYAATEWSWDVLSRRLLGFCEALSLRGKATPV